MVEHRNIIDAERHEAKGASSALAGQILRANGSGGTSFVDASSLSVVTIGSTLESSSLVSQSPVALDTAIQVNFGAASSNSDVSITAGGNITFTTSGLYFITFNLNFGRSASTAIAALAARLLLNGNQTGITQACRIDTSTDIVPFNASLLRKMTAGDVLSVQLIRDSVGTNDGGLFPLDPVTAGWATAPSAAVRVQKIAGGF